MNARQAAKAAAKKIEALEDFNKRSAADIREYNKCIDAMIQGKSPCKWCEENRLGECTKTPEDGRDGMGCEDWWLMTVLPDEDPEEGDAAHDEGTGIFPASPTG